jgi:hypothetical protein
MRPLCIAESSSFDQDTLVSLFGFFADFGTDVLSLSITVGPDK